MTWSTNSSRPDGSTGGMMLKPSAAPPSNQPSMLVGDLLGRAGEGAVAASAAEPPDQLPDGEILPRGPVRRRARTRLCAPSISAGGGRSAGSARVEVQLRERQLEQLGERALAVRMGDQLLEFGVTRRASASVMPMTGTMPGRILMWSGLRPAASVRGLEVRVERLRLGEGLLRGEDRLGVAGGEILAVLGRAGLHEQRMALRRARACSARPSTEKNLPRCRGRPDLAPVAPDAGLLVADVARRRPSCPTASSTTSTNSAARS